MSGRIIIGLLAAVIAVGMAVPTVHADPSSDEDRMIAFTLMQVPHEWGIVASDVVIVDCDTPQPAGRRVSCRNKAYGWAELDTQTIGLNQILLEQQAFWWHTVLLHETVHFAHANACSDDLAKQAQGLPRALLDHLAHLYSLYTTGEWSGDPCENAHDYVYSLSEAEERWDTFMWTMRPVQARAFMTFGEYVAETIAWSIFIPALLRYSDSAGAMAIETYGLVAR